MFLKVASPGTELPLANSFDPSLLSAYPSETNQDVCESQQKIQKRPWSLDDRFLTARERGLEVPKGSLFKPMPPLDKQSQAQLDEFEEVISRMATMTKGSSGPQSQSHESHPTPSLVESSLIRDDTLSLPSLGTHQLIYPPSDAPYFVGPEARPGVSRASTQMSPRSTPYPASTISSSVAMETTPAISRRGTTGDYTPTRPAPQVKIQLSSPWEPAAHVSGLPPFVPPQSAKMLNPTSRTQLKQQLMRQQLQQQEARERELVATRNLQHQSAHQQQSIQNQHQFFQPQNQQYRDHQQIQCDQMMIRQQYQPTPVADSSQVPANHQQYAPPRNQQHPQETTPQHDPQPIQQPANASGQQEPIDIHASTTMAIPTQVLQVQSCLENPTRYHVVQSHKRLLRQLRHDTSPEPPATRHHIQENPTSPLTISSHGGQGTETQPQWTCSDPGAQRFGAANHGVGFGSESHQLPPAPTSCSVISTKGIRGYTAVRAPLGQLSGGPGLSSSYINPPINSSITSYVSSGVSSAAASLTSDASEVDDVIEEILNLEEGLETGGNLKKGDAHGGPIPASQGDTVPGTICDLLGLNGFIGSKSSSASCPSDVPKIKKEPPSSSDPQVVAFMKDRQKKDNHNMIERRRRFNINDRIRDLSQLLPKTNEPYHEIVRDIRHNKGQILRASVDYIRRLKSDLEVSKGAEDKRRALEQQNRQLLLRVQELEAQLRMNGIKVEETKFNPNLLLPSMVQSEVMSPTSTNISPTTSPFSPTPTISPFTSMGNNTTSSPLNPINTGNFTATTTTTCSSGSDLADFNLCEEPSMISGHENNLLTELGVPDESTDTKKVKCPATHLPDFLLEDLLMADFPTENFGINLMDDDSLAFTSDPMFSSPQVSSPNSSRHSFEDALSPDSMDIVS